MKQLNPKIRNLFLSLVLTLIFVGATLYLFTNDSLLDGLKSPSAKQVMNDIRFQLAMVLIVCSGTGLLLLNTKSK